VAERLEEDEVSLTHIIDAIGRKQETTIVSESGLYNVILRSDKPEARKFKRWVTHEVLPSIRRHGAYVAPAKLEEIMNDPDAWIKVLTALKEERAARERLQLEAARNEPKVVFADAVTVSDGAILIGELAKILKGNGVNIGQNRLFERLRQDGYLIKRKGTDYNAPTQRAMELGCSRLRKPPSPIRTATSPSARPQRSRAKASSISSTCFSERGPRVMKAEKKQAVKAALKKVGGAVWSVLPWVWMAVGLTCWLMLPFLYADEHAEEKRGSRRWKRKTGCTNR
jgi:prophage antirepressor-like protein